MFVLIAISFKNVIPRKYPKIFPLAYSVSFMTPKREERGKSIRVAYNEACEIPCLKANS